MSAPSAIDRSPRGIASRQRGVVLVIALIILVAMTLAGIGMVRSIDTGTLVVGNLAFKQSATHGADAAAESGLDWLAARTSDELMLDQARGYFANWQDGFNPATFDWDNQGSVEVTDARTGNRVSYVIHRMCQNSNASANAPGQSCVSIMAASSGGTRGGAAYGQRALAGTIQVYYRVTARAVGPRNTVSYVQTVVY